MCAVSVEPSKFEKQRGLHWLEASVTDTCKVCLSLQPCWERRPHPHSGKVSRVCIRRTASTTGGATAQNQPPAGRKNKQKRNTHHSQPSFFSPAPNLSTRVCVSVLELLVWSHRRRRAWLATGRSPRRPPEDRGQRRRGASAALL